MALVNFAVWRWNRRTREAETHNFIDNPLVGVEIEREAGIAGEYQYKSLRLPGKTCAAAVGLKLSLFLDQNPRGPFGGLRPNAALWF